MRESVERCDYTGTGYCVEAGRDCNECGCNPNMGRKMGRCQHCGDIEYIEDGLCDQCYREVFHQ